MPKLAIITPVYNSGEYLIESVTSALRQSIQDVEVIVVDDGSTDQHTLDTLRSVERLDRVSVVRQPHSGVSAARNAAITLACSDYILPVDSDDYISPVYGERAIAILNSQPEIVIARGVTEMFGSHSGPFGPPFSIGRLIAQSIVPVGAVFRRDQALSIGGFDESLARYEDQDFFLRLLTLAPDPARGLYELGEPMYYYRKHSSSATAAIREDGLALNLSARAKVLHNNLHLLDRFAPEYLEFLDQQESMLHHFKSRYGRIERLISRLGATVKKIRH